ncbi:hypothetical protein GCM10027614_10580 [Micromonospora vulcania]
MIAVLALLAGVVLGVLLDPTVPAALQPYLPIAVVAALDAVFGGVRAKLDRIFDDKQFVVSFISNVLVAGLIVYLGDQLGWAGSCPLVWWSFSGCGFSATWRRSVGTCSGRRFDGDERRADRYGDRVATAGGSGASGWSGG